MKNLNELFNGITGIIKDTGDYSIDPDTGWFDDLKNASLNRSANGNSLENTTGPNVDQAAFSNNSSKPNISLVLKLLAKALFIQSQKPTLAGVDDIIHKLEKIITDYRNDLDEIPAYRTNVVKTNDPTQTINNLVYGPSEPNTRLAVMVSDLSPNSSNLDLGNVAVDTNTDLDSLKDQSSANINASKADRVNIVQPNNNPNEISSNIEDLIKDLAIKTAQIAAQEKQKGNSNSLSFGS